MTLFVATATSAALIVLTGVCLGRYPCETIKGTQDCSPRNFAITLALHILGFVALAKNIASVLIINMKIFGGFKAFLRNKFGFFEGFFELLKIIKGQL